LILSVYLSNNIINSFSSPNIHEEHLNSFNLQVFKEKNFVIFFIL
jgi:hypothetical protein